jgi:hypothetical protein
VRGPDSATRQNARGRGKGATQHIRLRFAAPGEGEEPLGSALPSNGGEGVRVSFHPLTSTVDNIMEVHRKRLLLIFIYKLNNINLLFIT